MIDSHWRRFAHPFEVTFGVDFDVRSERAPSPARAK
jgi:hypothetical protein